MLSRLFTLLSLTFSLVAVSASAELRLNRYFTDNMVLQRDKPVLIRGWAEPGETVTVEFAGQSKTAPAHKDGQWAITLDPMPASAEPQTIHISSATIQHEPLTITNVLVGDVLIFGRQSSIDVSLGKDSEGKKAAQGYRAPPSLRTIHIKAMPAEDPRENLAEKATIGWTRVDARSALTMNAAAFYLARDLAGRLDVPLGIVDIDMGPNFAASWLSDTALDESETLYPDYKDLGWFRKDMPKEQAAWDSGASAKEWNAYWEKRGVGTDKRPSIGLSPLERPYYPAACYNAVIYPLRGLTAKGMLLQLGNDYQMVPYNMLRESGRITNEKYLYRAWPQTYLIEKHANRMTPATLPLIPKDLRRSLGDPALPLGWIMPPGSDFYQYAGHNREVRELQRRIQAKTANLGLIMAGTEHVPLSGQPADEQLLAARCADWVMGTLYPDTHAVASGPVFDRMEVKDGEATIFFKAGTADGLQATGDALKQFEVAGPDKAFTSCRARIEGKTVKLTSDDVYYIQLARFNWQHNPDQGLVNNAGLPAIPFTTDTAWTYNWWPSAPPVELPLEYSTPAGNWPKRDVTIINAQNKLAGGDSVPNPNHLGPTGISAAPFGPNLWVHEVDSDSPAAGKVFVNDIIYGVNGENFGSDPDDKYHQFSAAITQAETRADGGKMVLRIRREGGNTKVELGLKVLGSYSATMPYYCPKSEKIVEMAEDWIYKRFRPDSGTIDESTGMLDTDLYFLMASGDPKVQGLVRRVIYTKLAKMSLTPPDPDKSANNWALGYDAMLLGEYYLLTGDRNVLPFLKNTVDWAAMTQIKPPGSKEVPWEVAHYDDVVGGWRTRYDPTGADRWKSGYGLMAAAGLPCVIGMELAKEAGLDIDDLALKRGIQHFYKGRAEYGYVLYWYHPLRIKAPRRIDPKAEANGSLWSMNGKLGTATALFNLFDDGYGNAVSNCSRYCVYGYNRTRSGHGGMFFNNFWTPIGAFLSGEKGFKHFMKGQTWWRELYRRQDGSFTQDGRGQGARVSFAIHYVAPKKLLRILDAPRSVFGADAPAYLRPALEAHQKRNYALAEKLVQKELDTTVIPAGELPRVTHFLESVRLLRKSVDYDLTYVEALLDKGKYYYASVELPQLKGVVAADNPRLAAILAKLESPEGKEKITNSQLDTQREEQEAKRENQANTNTAAVKKHEDWVCLVTNRGSEKKAAFGRVPEAAATCWRMKIVEAPAVAPAGWTKPDFDDSAWDVGTLPLSWRVSHTALFRCAFNVKDKAAFDALRLRTFLMRQRFARVYINGDVVAKIDNIGRMSETGNVLTDGAMDAVKEGDNTLAVMMQHSERWGKVKGFSGDTPVTFMLDARKTVKNKSNQ